MLRWLFVFLLFSPLCAEEEIVVHLAHEERLAPLYLDSIQDLNSGFSPEYLRALKQVLSFDLNYNGKTEVVSQPEGSAYIIKAAITEKKLSLSLLSVHTGSLKGIEKIALCGSLDQDRRVLHGVSDSIHQALFGAPGICTTRILYTVRTRNGASASEWITEVWEADYDGANAHQVTFHRGLCITPVYIPSSNGGRCNHVLYVCYQVGQPKIYATSVEKYEPVRLSYMRGNQLMPALSPLLDQIAFISDITGNPDLFVQDFSVEHGVIGKARQIFTAPNGAQGSPSFSPDGKKLAFVSNKDGTPRIYALSIPPAGAALKEIHPKLISKRNRENTSPVWSPDGKKIAYSSLTGGARQIWVYDFTTDTETQLTEGYGHKENPTWAPDSLHVLFNSSTPSASELFLINLHQKKTVKITSGPGEKRFPCWEPQTTRKI